MQSIDLIETFLYRTSKGIVSKKEEINCNNTIQIIIKFNDNGRKTGLKNFNDSKTFIENSNDMDDIYKL